MRQLESESIVETIPNKGPIVRQLTRAEAEDLYLIRSVLEGLAARMFVTHAAPDDLVALKDALDRTVAAYRDNIPEDILAREERVLQHPVCRRRQRDAVVDDLDPLRAHLAMARTWSRAPEAFAAAARSRASPRCAISIRPSRRSDGERAETIARQEALNAAAEINRIFGEAGAETL